jgi:hypothetical protein
VTDILTEILPADAAERAVGPTLTFREWIDRAAITLRGRPYSFEGHEYLEAIVDDDHPDQTFEKGAQVGISTVALLKGLYVADHLGGKCVYYFQDDGAVSDFSSDRAAPVIRESDYLGERVRDTDRVGLKQIGAGSLYFRGLFTKGKAKSVDADFVILDELDEAKQEHKEFALDRLMHSDLQWVFALSQPSFPGYGIDAEFQDTDRRYWFLRCPACGARQCLELDWPAQFIELTPRERKSRPDGTTHYRGCKKCAARLDMAAGEWVAESPSRNRRGYHLSQLFSQIRPANYPNLATKLMAEFDAARRSQLKMGRFMISVVGFPYAGANARITDELLDACEGTGGFLREASWSFMGVDQGDMLAISIWVRQAAGLVCAWIEETEDWARLDALMVRYGTAMCVIDAMPNKDSAKEFACRHRGRVHIQYFGGKELRTGGELHRGKTSVPVVTVDRTDTLDATVDGLEAGMFTLPDKSALSGRDLAAYLRFRSHLKMLIARIEETKTGRQQRVYLRNVQNHHGMALNSARIAAFELGVKPPATGTPPLFLDCRGGNA